MSLEQAIMADLKEAMRSKDEKALRSLRAIKAAIITAKTAEGAGGEIGPQEEMKILQKLVKQGKDSLEIYQQQNRADLAQKEAEEIEIIERYLPKQLSEDEVKDVLAKIIADLGAFSMTDMGKVMSTATQQLSGQADGKTINAIARELLSQSK
ncbi:MAG TPA: GatB/YqeY domain-containing protein [Stenomitos sp.]